MRKIFRSLLPQGFINIFYHLPLALVANIFYGFPTQGMTVIGVTGTDGKTTTTNMIYQILESFGKKVSMVSTINAQIGDKSYDTGFHVTSPDPFMVQKFARQARDQGSEYLVLEVTSHALDQYRFWGIKFTVGVITNVTHEHLDYHKSFENYFLTKAKLIRDVKVAVISRDENHFYKLSKLTMGKVMSFGFSKSADFNLQKFPLNLKMLGKYNELNALAAASVCTYLGVEPLTIKSTLFKFSNLSGRMEEIKNKLGFRVIVDFAHTPNALEQALKTLKKETRGKLIAVFGCAGKRDIGKRFLMGEISGKLADITLITAEDPRGELEKINQQIVAGAIKAGAKLDENLFVIGDRGDAIKLAVKMAQKGDIIGVFGKGHEKSMNYDGKAEIPWSDQLVLKKALNG